MILEDNIITSWIMNPFAFKNMVFGQGGKQIKVNCNICGKEHWLSLDSYYKKVKNYVCHHCSTHTDEFINRMIDNNPMKNKETKDKNSISQRKYYKNHPEAVEQKRKDGKKMHDDPVKKKLHTKKLKEYYSNLEIRELLSIKHISWWNDHPEERILQSKRATNQVHPPRSKESRDRYSKSKMGDKNPMKILENRIKSSCGIRGINIEDFGGFLYESVSHIFRKGPHYEHWRNNILKRDNYTCQECGKHGGKLCVHHILPCRDYKDIIYSLNPFNGITLCTDCHNKTIWHEYDYVEKYVNIVCNYRIF